MAVFRDGQQLSARKRSAGHPVRWSLDAAPGIVVPDLRVLLAKVGRPRIDLTGAPPQLYEISELVHHFHMSCVGGATTLIRPECCSNENASAGKLLRHAHPDGARKPERSL